jgi:modulator of FtsH protease
MDTLLPEGWGEFGVGATGATAALAGLLIVAISVNVKAILSSRVATHGASSTIASLVLALVASLLLLFPRQPMPALGVELAVALLLPLALQVRSIVSAAGDRRAGAEGVSGGVLAAIAGLAALQFAPFVIAVVLLIMASGIGVYALAAGVVLVVVASMVTAWALLVEVLR